MVMCWEPTLTRILNLIAGTLLGGIILLTGPTADLAVASVELQALETDGLRVRYAAARQHTAERIAAISPALFRELAAATGLAFDFRPTVMPAARRSTFRRLGGNDTLMAFARPQSKQVVLDLSRFDSQPALLRPVLKHEYAHLLLHRHIAAPRLPRWLDEGIAQHLSDGLSEYLPGRQERILGEALAADRVFPLAALAVRFPADRYGRQLAYEQSRSIVGAMVRDYGDRFLPALLALMVDGATAAEAFQSVSGISLAEAEAVWRQRQTAPLSLMGRLAGHVYGLLFFMAGLATLAGYIRHRRRRRVYDTAADDEEI
jgi:hypothetical protein